LAYARKAYRENAEGIPVPDMDLKIGEAYRAAPATPQNLWPVFAQIQDVPMILLRGATYDILSAETVQHMAREKPGLQAVTIPNRGHAPLLDESECIAAIDSFLATLSW